MKRTPTPSANGHPAARAKTTPRKNAAKPESSGRKLRGPEIRIVTVEMLADYHDALKRMQKCRGFKQIQRIVTQAHAFRELVADTIQNYGPGSGSPTEVFLRDFHIEEGTSKYVWDALSALAVDLGQKAAVPFSVIPGIK